MSAVHYYNATITWTGNRGVGTSGYRAYDRTWDLANPGKPIIKCSNDPLLGGDPTLYNPEDMLISALSACHMLWYLHLASDAGIIVERYILMTRIQSQCGYYGWSIRDSNARRQGACEIIPFLCMYGWFK